jgi:hypothetical protein
MPDPDADTRVLQAAQGFTRLLAAAEDAALDTPAAAHLLVRRRLLIDKSHVTCHTNSITA